ncbi:MAG: MGMT family protein [Clostridiales bacterium]|jgi:methylated-DNA-protein-cysteine methyltransferase-like protein|nr:MGMT family protein [Clostridiales bacterium]
MGFFDDVYEVVKRVPKGKVTSYGRVAAAVGRPRAARVVGYALHGNPDPDNIPCHRVVFKDGALSKAFAFGGENAQKAILESEGVVIEDGKVKAEYFIR